MNTKIAFILLFINSILYSQECSFLDSKNGFRNIMLGESIKNHSEFKLKQDDNLELFKLSFNTESNYVYVGKENDKIGTAKILFIFLNVSDDKIERIHIVTQKVFSLYTILKNAYGDTSMEFGKKWYWRTNKIECSLEGDDTNIPGYHIVYHYLSEDRIKLIELKTKKRKEAQAELQLITFKSNYIIKKKLNILILLLIFTTQSSCQVTSIKPLSSYDYSKGSYLKDTNNQLPFYLDAWEGIYDNKKYTFEFNIFYQHMTDYGNGHYYYEDTLSAKFKVVDLITGLVLFDNLSASNFDDYLIYLTTLSNGGRFLYLDTLNCYNTGTFSLFKVNGTTNQLFYNQFALTEYIDFGDCPYSNQDEIPMFLPTGDFILTKQ